MHADFGAEPAVGVFAGEFDGGGFDAGDVARRFFDEFGFEAARLAPAQVHAQQHGCPVLRLGAAGARLDVEEGVVRVQFAGEHAAEFEVFDAVFDAADVFQCGIDGGFVVFGFGQFDEVKGVLQALADVIQSLHDAGERGAFLPQFGRFFGVVPDGGALQFALDFFEALGLQRVVKDTP